MPHQNNPKFHLNAEVFDITAPLATDIKKKIKCVTKKCKHRHNLGKKKTSRMVHTLFCPGTRKSDQGKYFNFPS